MAKKSETKRSSTRSTRQTGRGRGTKTQPGSRKQSEPQMHGSEENMDMEDE
jgi:hypothetical protein